MPTPPVGGLPRSVRKTPTPRKNAIDQPDSLSTSMLAQVLQVPSLQRNPGTVSIAPSYFEARQKGTRRCGVRRGKRNCGRLVGSIRSNTILPAALRWNDQDPSNRHRAV